MLAIRLLLGLIAVTLILSLLGYAVSRDKRWLRFAGLGIKTTIALIAILMLVYLIERLLVAL